MVDSKVLPDLEYAQNLIGTTRNPLGTGRFRSEISVQLGRRGAQKSTAIALHWMSRGRRALEEQQSLLARLNHLGRFPLRQNGLLLGAAL